ncbi:MAG: hypothetical protein B6244_06265 [Candidatus Cloacimonetes bacterium 4572_55]|nr:MAG: hypothetical protein B6244_06265 [Candidatus Cloacimonetes bacterium 4572_55]
MNENPHAPRLQTPSTDVEQALADLYFQFLQSFQHLSHGDQFYITYHAKGAQLPHLNYISQQIEALAPSLAGHAGLHLLRGHLARHKGNLDQAIQEYELALNGRQTPLTAHGKEPLFALGAAHFQKENYEIAVRIFAEYQQQKPNDQSLRKFFTYSLQDTQPVTPTSGFPYQPMYQPPLQSPAHAHTRTGIAASSSNIRIPRVPGAVEKNPEGIAPIKKKNPKNDPPCCPEDSNKIKKSAPKKKSSGQKILNSPPREGCFIATAAYGGPDAVAVVRLRHFRDRQLKNSLFGRKFISFYYNFSPPIAKFIADKPSLKTIVRAVIRSILPFLP